MTDLGLLRANPEAAQLWQRQRRAVQSQQHADAVPIGVYFRRLRRHRALLVISLLIGFAIGLGAASLQTPTWVSGATVLATPLAVDPQISPSKPLRPRQAVTLDTEAAILVSSRVLPRAVADTGVSQAQLIRKVLVTAVPNSRVLRIQVRDTDQARAKLLLSNLTDSYLDARKQLLTERRTLQADNLRQEIAALVRHGGDEDEMSADLEERLQVLRTRLSVLETHEIEAGELLRSATTARKVNVQPEVSIISWTLIAFLVGGALAALREWRPTAPRTAAQVARLPIARQVPVAVLDKSGPVDDQLSGWSRIADAIGARPSCTVITPLRSESVIAAAGALTVGLRQRGYLVSAILGGDHESPAGYDVTARMLHLRQDGRHVVVDAPGLATLGTSLSITQTDGVVLLMAPGRSKPRDIDAAFKQVVRLGVPVLGVILDRSASSRHRLPLLGRLMAS
ncbi:MAG TPA: hypothetical protein VLL08_08695 [Kineosporiaceae bacterium]|nr:hypothetical protein [Kineosporiaceae bacterium]